MLVLVLVIILVNFSVSVVISWFILFMRNYIAGTF